jgi:acetyl esterase/lipase
VVSPVWPRAASAGAVAVGLALLGGCSTTAGGAAPSDSAALSPSSATAAVEADYLPGLGAALRVPDRAGPAPLVVLVPGGGWSSADPTGLVPLAERLTADGAATALVTYSTTGDGTTFPTGVDDVACAVRWSAQAAAAQGHPPSPLVVLGHSAGGHLASLVALSDGAFGGDCPYPAVDVDGLVGMAGVYDIDAASSALVGWMGSTPQEDPPSWQRADPMRWVGAGNAPAAGIRVLLLHGDADDVVPRQQTDEFAAALSAAGVDVTTTILPGLDHLSLFEADNAEPPIRAWLQAWPAG